MPVFNMMAVANDDSKPAATNAVPVEQYYSREHVAKLFKVSLSSIDRLIAAKNLKSIRIGQNVVRIAGSEITRYVNRHG